MRYVRAPSSTRGLRAVLVLAGCLPVLLAGLYLGQQRAEAAPRYILVGQGRAACPGGYLCLWEAPYFTGRGVGFFNSESWYSTIPAAYQLIQNNAESAFNNGNTHDIRLGRYGYLDGGTMVLCRGDSIDFFEGGRGDQVLPGAGWKNQFSSHQFFLSAWC